MSRLGRTRRFFELLQNRATHGRRKQFGRRLRMECLEDRRLLAAVPVNGIGSDNYSSGNIGEMAAVGNVLYFTAYNATYGSELWRTEGDEQTTKAIDIRAGGAGSNPGSLTPTPSGKLFFVANDGTYGSELWVITGPGATPQIIDVRPGSMGSSPDYLTAVGDWVYFSADGGDVFGRELWRSDGTTAQRVGDIFPFANSSFPRNLVEAGGKLFFNASFNTNNWGIYVIDNATSDPRRLLELNTPTELVAVGDEIFFVNPPVGLSKALWKSDGTSTQAVSAKTSSSLFSSSLTPAGHNLFFVDGIQFWVSDGTDSGTMVVGNVLPQLEFSGGYLIEGVDGLVYFAANDGTTGYELWVSDGTSAGTHLVKDIMEDTASGAHLSSNPQELTAVDGTLYFTATDLTGNAAAPSARGEGRELWESRGTEATTHLVVDLYPGHNAYGVPYSSTPEDLFDANGTLYFTAETVITIGQPPQRRLWKLTAPDTVAPSATSFVRQTPATSLTNANTLVFRATFSEAVANVDIGDFAVNGSTTAVVTNVTAVSASQYDVTISGGNLASFNGTVGLNLRSGQNIADLAGNALPTIEPTTDQMYTLDNIAPSTTSFLRQTPATSPTNADTLVFRATFSEAVANVDTGDFAVNGTTTATVTNVAPISASQYDVTISGGNLPSFNGTVGLNLKPGQNIADLAGNALPTTEPATDQTYTLDNVVPNAPPTLNALGNLTLNEDATTQTVNLTGITAGPAESQALQVTASSSNTGLIPNPGIAYTSPQTTGSLSFTPVANQSGTAVITVTVRDAGLDRTLGNADDATFARSFTVTVNAVNDLPTARLIVQNVTIGGGATHTIWVSYNDDAAVDVASLDSNDILVSGPNGFSQGATFVSVNISTNGTSRMATYRINAPGGSWDQVDNGTYTVQMRNAAVRDTSNNYVASGTLGTFSVNVAPPNAAASRVFHLLALIYPEVQIPQNGSAPATSASMDQATLEAITAGVQVELPTMINQLAGDQIQARVHVQVVDRPLSQLYWDGAHYQWATESMIAPELDAFTKSGWYDHVFVFHGLVNEFGPTAWWGGGGLARYGMSMASLSFSRSDGKLGDHDVPGMIHEWMHGLEVQYFGVRGVSRGNAPDGQSLDLHDAGKFGYTDITENRPGWSAWYRDFLTDRIRNLHSDGSDTGLGLGPDAWILGMPRHDVPYTPGSPLERPDVTNTRPVFLSDIYWADAETDVGEIRRDATMCDYPIRIHGVEYEKGVGIHANGKIVVNLRGRAERFQADVGVDDADTPWPSGSVIFKIFGDGNLLFTSGVMSSADAAESVDIEVIGVNQLLLVVEDAGDGIGSDHGVWANAVFLPFAGEFISELRWDSSVSQYGAIHLDKTMARDDIRINGVTYGKGVGIHAHGEIVVPLDRRYSVFKSDVGILDDGHAFSSVSFEVHVDGGLAYESPTMRAGSPRQSVEVDVAGAQELRLIVRDAGDGIYADHGNWAGAHLTYIDFVVSNTDDSGLGSLRQAILDANSNPARDTIRFDIPGAGPHTIRPVSPLPVITDAVVIDGWTEPDFAGQPFVELDGSLAGSSHGLVVTTADSLIRGMAINRFGSVGIMIAGATAAGNVLQANFIGTNTAGTAALGNGQHGIWIGNGAHDNVIGTNGDGVNDALEGNLVSGNAWDNIAIVGLGTNGNVIAGNRLGTATSGMAALGGGTGVIIVDGAEFNRVGTDGDGFADVAERNILSGNRNNGVLIGGTGTDENVVAGNYIGVGADGLTAVGNTRGVRIEQGAQRNRIGTDGNGLHDTAERNVISGNLIDGILIIDSGTDANVVAGNFVGVEHSGTVAVPNVFSGIGVARGASGNRIGTDANGIGDAAEANVASGNGYYGVALVDVGTGQNIVAGNVIGTDLSGTRALGNTRAGVEIRGAIQNRIGGTTAAEANRIAFNGGEGIYLAETWGNSLLRNSIYANVGLGIDLDRDGVTANDPGDSDDGANRRQNFPVLQTATITGSQLTILGALNSRPSANYRIEFFSNAAPHPSGNRQGKFFLGTVNITTDGSGNATISYALNTLSGDEAYITATATDSEGNTSEFAQEIQATTAVPTLAITATDAVKLEGNSNSTPFLFTVTRSGPTTGVTTVNWAVAGSGTNPANGTDFVGGTLPSGTLTFNAGETVKAITVNVAGDTAVEANEGFTVTLSNASNAQITTATASGTIVNDDIALAITAADSNKLEGNSSSTPFLFTVTRSGLTTGVTTVSWTVIGNGMNPANAADFAGGTLPSGTVTFNAGETTNTITVNVAGDTLVELDEGFTVTLSNASNAQITTATASGTVLNDEITLAITATDAVKLEGDGSSTPFLFTVARSGLTTGATTINWAVAGSGTNPASAADFVGGTLPSGTLTFNAGETAKTVTVNVAGDTALEPDEGFTVTLSNASNAQITTATASGTILNDEITLAITTTDAVKPEGNGSSTPFLFTVTRANLTTGVTTVSWAVTGSGTNPANAADFVGGTLPSGTLTFNAGETAKTITVNVAGDTLVEPDEGFNVTLSNASNGQITTATASGTILNDEITLAITATDALKLEGNGGSTPFLFSVIRSGSTTGVTTVNWAAAGSSTNPANAADFVGGTLPSGTLTFNAGETAKTITVNVTGDTTVEPDEGFTVTLSNASNAQITTGTAVATILNDDQPTTSNVEITLNLVELDAIPGIASNELFDVQVHFRDLTTTPPQAAYAGYVDVLFPPNLVEVQTIIYAAAYPYGPTGTINNTSGVVEEVGAAAANFSAVPADDVVFTLRAKALAAGTAELLTKEGENASSEIIIYGDETDHRYTATFGTLEILIAEYADLVAQGFEAAADHLPGGQSEVTFTIANTAAGPAGPFDVQVVLSDNDVIGDADDVVVETLSYPGLAGNSHVDVSHLVEFPRNVLYDWARRDNPQNLGVGWQSTSCSLVALVIDPENQIEELDNLNNSNQGLGIDLDDVSYFPWDFNGNGTVTASDVMGLVNRLGATVSADDTRADLDGNGAVTASEAMGAVTRLGYVANGSVVETAAALAAGAVLEPDALAGGQATSNAATSALQSPARVILELQELDSVPGLVVGEPFLVVARFADVTQTASRAVYSGYADITFDAGLLRIDSIEYAAAYPYGRTGSIFNGAGLVDEVGATAGDFSTPSASDVVFVLRSTALASGSAALTAGAGQAALSEIILYGDEQDQRQATDFGTLTAQIAAALHWHNIGLPWDVDGNGSLAPLDALLLITRINSHPGDDSLPAAPAVPPRYYDVNRDGFCTAADVLSVINRINSMLGQPGEGEAAEPGVAGVAGWKLDSVPVLEDSMRFGMSAATLDTAVAWELPAVLSPTGGIGRITPVWWAAEAEEVRSVEEFDGGADVWSETDELIEVLADATHPLSLADEVDAIFEGALWESA